MSGVSVCGCVWWMGCGGDYFGGVYFGCMSEKVAAILKVERGADGTFVSFEK